MQRYDYRNHTYLDKTEFSYLAIHETEDYHMNYQCKYCLFNLRKKINDFFDKMDCTRRNSITAEELWINLKNIDGNIKITTTEFIVFYKFSFHNQF